MKTFVCKSCGQELPQEKFPITRWGGRSKICTSCKTKKRSETIAKKKELLAKQQEELIAKTRSQRLSDFTPRELMQELKDRGYRFSIEYDEEVLKVVTHKISSNDI